MGDEEGDFVGGGDETGDETGGGGGCAQKLQTAICSCCLGLFLFPFSLWLLGWNERNFVCTQKQIFYAEENAREWPCVDNTEMGENQLYHFSCPFDPTSYSDFTARRFNPSAVNSGDESLQTLLDSFRFNCLGGEQKTQIFTCVETRHERRSVSTGSGERRRRTQPVVTYTYALAWTTALTAFHQNPLVGGPLENALRSCPGVPVGWQGSQPSFPPGIDDGTNTRYADSVTAASVALPDTWIEEIPLDTLVTAIELEEPLTPSPALAGGWHFADDGPDAPEATITDCASLLTPSWGCVKLTYRKSSATQASVIANVGSGSMAGPEMTPSSWACGADEYYAFHPSSIAMTLEDIITLEHSSNSAEAWMIRIGGLVLAWVAVFCLCAPVTFAADIFGDCLAFIPCVGGLMEDIVEGLVNAVVCCISCSIGCSSGLCVIAIVMLVMRPLWGGLLMLAACCLIGCAFALSSQAPRKQKQGAEEMNLIGES